MTKEPIWQRLLPHYYILLTIVLCLLTFHSCVGFMNSYSSAFGNKGTYIHTILQNVLCQNFPCFTKSHIFSIPGTRSQSTLIMDSLAFLPLRCLSNSLIMGSFYILVLIYASCGTLWICWLSPVPSRPLVWTCCKSFHVLYAFIFPTIGQNVL